MVNCTVCPGSGTVVILVSTITPSELRVMVSTPSLPRSSSLVHGLKAGDADYIVHVIAFFP